LCELNDDRPFDDEADPRIDFDRVGTHSPGGITWHNYRGTDDNSTVAIAPDEAKFFPVGARDVFKKAQAPAEFGPYVNSLGQDTYAMNIPDRDRQAWTGGELYSYPLYFCQRARCAAERGEVTMAQYHVKNGSSVDKAFKVRAVIRSSRPARTIPSRRPASCPKPGSTPLPVKG
jgi:hypothetical protein